MTEPAIDLPEEVKNKVVAVCDRARGQLGVEIAALCRRYGRFAGQIWHYAESLTGLRRSGEFEEAKAGARRAQREARGGTYVGPYRVIKPLGKGGMGVVYLAEQTEPVKRQVAVKVIRSGVDIDQVLSRFALERQALAVMNHASIARVFEAGETSEGSPYFVMEYVPGVPIDEYCETNKLSLTDRLVLFQQVCAGVQHAHQKGVIHRDLTARNVLVTEEEGRAVPKIIDFGLARATDLELVQQSLCTEAGLVVGTPEYMSPEQINPGQDIDTRTDVYSLGVLLYNILTSALPFPSDVLRAGGFAELQRVIIEQDPPRPSLVVEMLSEDAAEQLARRRQTNVSHLLQHLRTDLDWVVLKCLEKDRNQRYETPSELAAEIGRYLADEPLVAGPPSAGYRLRKLLRRHRGRVAAAVALAVALVAGMLGTTHGLLSAKANAAVAEANAEHARAEKLEADRQRERANQNASFLMQQSERLRHQTILALAARQLALDPWLSLAYVREVPADSALAAASLQVTQDALAACDGPWHCASRLLGHEGRVTALEMHPDGQRALTASRDGTVRIWRIGGAAPVVLQHPDEVVLAQFTPDGLGVLTVCRDGIVRVFGTSGADRPVTFPRDVSLPRQVVFDPAGERFVTISADGLARMFDARRPAADPRSLGSDVNMAAFSPDGQRLLLAGHSEVARLLSANGEGLGREIRHEAPIVFATFSPDGSRVLTASEDHTLRMTPVESIGAPVDLRHPDTVTWAGFAAGGTVVFSLAADNVVRTWSSPGGTPISSYGDGEAAVLAVEVAPDGNQFATIGADNAVRVWQTAGGKKPVSLRHDSEVQRVLFLGVGEQILTLGSDRRARIWDVASPRRPRVLEHPGGLEFVAYHPTSRALITVATNGTARVWRHGGASEPRPYRFAGAATAMARSPLGDRIAIGGDDGRVAVFDAATAEVLATLAGHERAVRSLDFSADGKTLVSGADDGSVRCTSLEGAWATVELSGHRGQVAVARFSPSADRVATASLDGTVRLWQRDGSGEPRVLRGHRWSVVDLCFSPDGESLATASWDGSVRIWSVRREEEPVVLRHPDKVYSVCFSRDGKHVATACEDGTARVFDADGRSSPIRLQGHTRALHRVAFDPTGTRVVSVSADHTARVWHSDGTGTPRVLRGHGDDVVAAQFSPDGRHVVTASLDQTARVWDMDGETAPLVLRHGGPLSAAAFTDEGAVAMTLAPDGVRAWTLAWPALRQWVAENVSLALSATERSNFEVEAESPAEPPAEPPR
ncbi:MAG: protein kinase [Planctomycetota bacterium]